MSAKMNRLPGEGGTRAENSGLNASACLDMRATAGEFPAHGTQAARFLALLLVGREVGPLAGWREIGIYRLADTKLQLRKAGWKIEKETQKRPNKFGEQCAFASYFLPPEVIEAAGAAGQEFARRETKLMADIARAKRGVQ